MVTLQKLRSERERILTGLRRIDEKASKEKRLLTNAEQKEWDSLEADIDAVNGQIDKAVEEKESKIDKILGMETKVKKEENYRWIDQSNGKEVRVLRPDQPLYTPTGEEKDLDLGRALRALAIGDFKGAEAEQRIMTTAGSASVKIPTVLSAQLIQMARDKSVVFQAGVRTIDMPSGNLTLAKETDVATISAEYKAEGAAFTYQDISFESMSLQAKTMGAMAKISRELAQDASNISQILLDRLSSAIADEIDRAFLLGLGTAADPFTGILTLAGTQEIAAVGALSNYNPFIDAYIKALDVNAEPNAIVMATRELGSLAKLVTTDGQYMQKPTLISSLAQLYSNKLPTDGGAGVNESSAVLGDFTKAFYGITQGLTIETSTIAGETFKNHEVAFKVSWRGDLAYEKANNFVKLSGITA